MSKKEKPLPKPPTTPFGRKKRFEESEEDVPLLADQIAKAMAEGKLGEFLQQEIPDNEHARKLVSMMMSMTGMLPPEGISIESKEDEEKPSSEQPPEDVLKAVQTGDVQGLMELLKREHEKRMSEASQAISKESRVSFTEQPSVEKEIIGQLIKIADDNNVTLDWIILRALKLYAEEYGKTGRL